MTRTDRLFEILQLFRDGRLLSARDIPEALEVSFRFDHLAQLTFSTGPTSSAARIRKMIQ